MKRLSLWLLWVSLALTVSYANTASAAIFTSLEREVSFCVRGQTVRGVLTVPAEKDASSPAILLLHGFLGHQNDLRVYGTTDGLYPIVARCFAQAGLVTLRFDFRGSGESDGNWEETTFSRQILDAQAAVDFLIELGNVNPEKIGAIGLSQGGLVAACLGARDDRIGSIALWSPVAIPIHTYGHLLGFQTLEKALLVDETLTSPISWGGTTRLNSAFFREMFEIDPLAEIAYYQNPLLVAVGIEDPIVYPQPESGELFLTYHPGVEALLVFSCDHIFNLFSEWAILDTLIDETLLWFLRTLE